MFLFGFFIVVVTEFRTVCVGGFAENFDKFRFVERDESFATRNRLLFEGGGEEFARDIERDDGVRGKEDKEPFVDGQRDSTEELSTDIGEDNLYGEDESEDEDEVGVRGEVF